MNNRAGGGRRWLPGRRTAPQSADSLGAPFASFGPRSAIAEPWLGIPNPTGIAIGAGVDIRPYAFLEALAPKGTIVLRIGDGSYIGPFARITAMNDVTIGSKVLIADRCFISDTDHTYEDVDVPIMDQPLRPGRRIHIGDGSWLGIGVCVVGDVEIGAQSVVAASSVVRHDVPPFTVVAGSPARVVRRFVDGRWERE